MDFLFFYFWKKLKQTVYNEPSFTSKDRRRRNRIIASAVIHSETMERSLQLLIIRFKQYIIVEEQHFEYLL